MKNSENVGVRPARELFNLAFSRALVASVLAATFIAIRVLVFYDAESGLLKNDTISLVLFLIASVFVIYMAAAAFIFSGKLKKAEETFTFEQTKIDAIALFIGAAFFVVQFLTDLSTIIASLIRIADGIDSVKQAPGLLTWSCCIFAFLSAVSFALQGAAAIKRYGNTGFLLSLPPVIWSLLMLLNVIMTYPLIVSIQADAEKVILCSMTVLFVYYMLGKSTGLAEKKQVRVGLLVRILFPVVGLAFSLPYGVAWICGIKDRVITVPYIAIIGLSIMGLLLLIKRREKTQPN